MARKIKIPSKEELRPGARRSFVDELFERYRDAHRPSLRQISDATKGLGPGSVHVSPETIRRMLNGTTVPGHWPIVEAVLTALCHLGGTEPDQAAYDGTEYMGDVPTYAEKLESAWASRPGLPR